MNAMNRMYDKIKFFKSYFGRASEKKIFLENFDKRFSSPAGKEVSFLDLGCHDGHLMLQIIDRVKDRLPDDVYITGVDPSSSAIEEFSQKRLGRNIRADFCIQTAEEFFDKQDSLLKFNWIIASHCLYWSKRLENVIQKIISTSDQAVIVLRNQLGIYQIQSQFKKLLGSPDEQLYIADNIQNVLDNLNCNYRRENYETKIELPDESSKEFLWLISFFLQTTEDKLTKNDLDRIKPFLRSLGNPMRHDVSFFWIDSRA